MQVQVAGLRFEPAGKILQYIVQSLVLDRGDKCVAESNDGLAVATVVIAPEDKHFESQPTDLKRVIRKATLHDLDQAEGYKYEANEALNICREFVQQHQLPMKPVSVNYTLDGRKAVFYFTADDRVDFRALVKFLAERLRTRIEMRQIGVRDEAKQLGGYGVCGRPLCCSTFLTEFAPISVRMAKEQGLNLNPSRISGVCGRLKCCLAYEMEVYQAIRDELPRIGTPYMTEEGPGHVSDITIIGEAFEVIAEETGNRFLFRLPSAEARTNHCKSDCGKGGGCQNGSGCGSGGCG
ncbi:MAG: stage 0 sporulation family protein [bacterium]|nr:stage 0 sporulation family protein [bacterium]